VNDKGESDGFEVAVLKAVDELLADYEFQFVPTSDDDLLIGVESGKYQVGTKGAWVTEERKKKFLFPQNHIAASIIGITYRAADKDSIKDIDSFAAFSGKLVPIAPQSAQFAVVQEYNAAHPDKPIQLVPADTFVINDAYAWVLEGRYDAFFDIKLSYLNSVVSEKGAFHSLADKLVYAPYKGIPTWPLFNKSEGDFAAAYDGAIETLRANGELTRLSQVYFGEDVFQYISK
jgi:L-cystine transport system substrate-binding protein